MKIRMTNEAKTGALVLVCAAVLGALILKVGDFKLMQEGYTVKSRFHYTAGVKRHSPVHLSGVDVGEVQDIEILYGDETLIELELWIEEGVKIRKDSSAYITTLGLMGEKYVEVKAGSAAAPYAAPGEVIPSEDPARLEDLISLGTRVAGDIDKMAKDIQKVAQSADVTITENRAKINHIFENLEETSENFAEFSQDIKYHPWKILAKGRERSKEEMARERAQRRETR